MSPGATKKIETMMPARMKPNAFTLRPNLSATQPQNHAPNSEPNAEIEKMRPMVNAAYAPITISATENIEDANAVNLPRTVGVNRPIIRLTATVK